MSGKRVNRVSLCESLDAKIHARKPHDVTDVVCMCVPCAPFLDMVWVAVNRGDTRRFSPSSVSCTNKVHKIHATYQSARRIAVFTCERPAEGVHTRFTRFTEVFG
jgi:hypothetical protein